MKKFKLKYLFLIALYVQLNSFAQEPNLDSLFKIWNNGSIPDTTRCNALSTIAYDVYLFSQPDSGLYYTNKLYKFAELKNIAEYKAMALNFKGIYYVIDGNTEKALTNFLESLNIKKESGDLEGVASSYNNIGLLYKNESNFDNALYYYKKALKTYSTYNDKIGIAGSLNNIGNIYQFKGDYSKAVTSYLKSLKVCEQINDKKGIANALNNIGLIYKSKNELNKALNYFEQSLEIEKQLKNEKGIATSLNNIGSIYEQKNNFYKAFEYYEKSLELEEKIKNDYGISETYNNIANVLLKQGSLGLANIYYNKALKKLEKLDDKKTLIYTLIGLGKIYLQKKEYQKAKSYAQKAFDYAEEIESLTQSRDAAKLLYKINKKTNNIKQALKMYETYNIKKDSVLNIQKQEEIIKQEYKYKYDKKIALDSVKNENRKKIVKAKMKIQEEKIEHSKTIKTFLIIGLSALLLFSLFLYNRFIIIKRQKNIITQQKQKVTEAHQKTQQQKELIEIAHKEITDSIKYAKRIQNAILPSMSKFKSLLPNSFVFYKPKDVVSGDFYWIEEKNNHIIFAAADCTGHGVPGAMVSVICNNGLNRAVREHGLTEPNKILDKTRDIVLSEFEKSNEKVKDGMDIALCSINNNFLEFAGANNPLFHIRNKKLTVIKGDKQPIGKVDNPFKFTSHKIELEKNDTIYIFTDGYVDQFGGEKNKKFRIKALKELLLSIQHLNIEEQNKIVVETFNNWKGQIEQVDDVCLIGIKI